MMERLEAQNRVFRVSQNIIEVLLVISVLLSVHSWIAFGFLSTENVVAWISVMLLLALECILNQLQKQNTRAITEIWKQKKPAKKLL